MTAAREYHKADFDLKIKTVLIYVIGDQKGYSSEELDSAIADHARKTYDWWLTDDGFAFFKACAANTHPSLSSNVRVVRTFLEADRDEKTESDTLTPVTNLADYVARKNGR